MGPPVVIIRQLLNILVVLVLPDSGFPKAQLASALRTKLLNSAIKAEDRDRLVAWLGDVGPRKSLAKNSL